MRPGEVLNHPQFGTRITFLRTAEESEGGLIEWETVYKAHRGKEGGNIPHFHVTFVEQYQILEGTAAYELEGEERHAHAGEIVAIPRGAVHRNVWNAGEAEMRFRTHIEMNPPNLRAARFFQDIIETSYGLAREGKVNADGLPKSYLHTAMLAQGFQPESWLAGIPIPIQRVVIGALAALGRARGYRIRYPQYTTDNRTSEPA
jgi:mannose-6-phosphate isomerase-like protein (cupin superfamily)